MSKRISTPPPPGAPRLQGRPDPGWAGPGVCVFTELLAWSKIFYAVHMHGGRIPVEGRRELEAGLGNAIRNAEEFLKD